ncbi:M56 family metallopeptidase [Pontibacter liquoris]|uniref:M56 family metallopeptidase n=1 Tax=Pontibacter liquoris TaxID=2905677 RepID=UPI001FA80B59|nr:M56 family metallopeptidase [Pontibacter liquoris]
MIALLLKASFALGVALLFYKLLLQQESFFRANRIYLLGCIVLAFALPFVNLPQLVSRQGYLATVFERAPFFGQDNTSAQQSRAADQEEITGGVRKEAVTQIPYNGPQEEAPNELQQYRANEQAQTTALPASSGQTFSLVFWLAMLYFFGVAVFGVSLLLQVGSIFYKVYKATDKIEDGDCVLVNTAERQAPCSFFHYIFIYPDEYDFETYEQIIAHEKIHVRLGHSLDLLLAEITVIILWFNPLAWLMKREIEKNIEYQTDAALLEKVPVSRDRYQLNLLQIAVPHKPLSITTNYNQSLLKQRIMKMNAKKSTPHAYWKYAFLAPLFFGTLLLLNEPASSQNRSQTDAKIEPVPVAATALAPQTVPNPEAAPAGKGKKTKVLNEKVKEKVKERAGKNKGFSLNIQGDKVDLSQGYWYNSQENGQYCLELKGSKGSSNWNMNRCFDKGLFQKKGNDTFVMTREAGTLQLSGNLEAEAGQGKYTFTPDASFKKYLADNRINSDDKNLLFHLFFGNVDRSYISYLKQNYEEVEGERLQELAIFDISKTDFQQYVALFQKYSNKKPSLQEVVEARIQGIDEAYVRELASAGYKDLSMKKMMEAKIHGVSDDYIKGLQKAGYANLPIDKVIETKIFNISPENIKEMQSLGYGELPLDKMVELRVHGINKAYLQQLKDAGLNNLTLDQVIQAKVMGLDANDVKKYNALGFKGMDFEKMIAAKIHGVDAAFVQDLKKAGFPNLDFDDAVAARIHGIDSNFINKARKDGYNLNSIDKYIELKIHSMAMKSLKE